MKKLPDIPFRTKLGQIKLFSTDEYARYISEIIDNKTIVINEDEKLEAKNLPTNIDYLESIIWDSFQYDKQDNREIYTFYYQGNITGECILIHNDTVDKFSLAQNIQILNYNESKKIEYVLEYDPDEFFIKRVNKQIQNI